MSAHRHHEEDGTLLKKRADYFFASKAYARHEVKGFAELLLTLGPVVAIGGLLRDLCLSGTRDFKSDVDFVVDPGSMSEFESVVRRLGGKVNKFGGYGIALDRWKVDVWPLARTWAAVAGHATIAGLDDLVKVTFFDWDAILYSVADQKLIPAHSYFDRVRSRILDINLEPNPNPLGNAVRALRYAYRWDAALGERLASHVMKQIRDHGWDVLVSSERASFAAPVLSQISGEMIVATLRDRASRHLNTVRLPLRPLQEEIELVGGTTRSEPVDRARAIRGRRRTVRSSEASTCPAGGRSLFGA